MDMFPLAVIIPSVEIPDISNPVPVMIPAAMAPPPVKGPLNPAAVIIPVALTLPASKRIVVLIPVREVILERLSIGIILFSYL